MTDVLLSFGSHTLNVPGDETGGGWHTQSEVEALLDAAGEVADADRNVYQRGVHAHFQHIHGDAITLEFFGTRHWRIGGAVPHPSSAPPWDVS